MLRQGNVLYGLTESEDCWGKVLSECIVEDLGMVSCTLYSPVFSKHDSESLRGVCTAEVVDALPAGSDTYAITSKGTEKKFVTKEGSGTACSLRGCKNKQTTVNLKVTNRPTNLYLSESPNCKDTKCFDFYA